MASYVPENPDASPRSKMRKERDEANRERDMAQAEVLRLQTALSEKNTELDNANKDLREAVTFLSDIWSNTNAHNVIKRLPNANQRYEKICRR